MEEKLRISGGIILGILAEARLTNPKSSRMGGVDKAYLIENPCDISKLLSYLAGIAGPEYSVTKLKRTASSYKNCDGQGGLGLDEAKYIKTFNDAMNTHYDLLIKRTERLFQECICNTEDKRILLAERLYWLLENTDQNFTFSYLNKKNVSRADFLKIRNYEFIPFFLAVWHSITTKIANNKSGAAAFKKLFANDDNRGEFHFSCRNSVPSRNITFANVLSPEEPIIIEEDIPSPQDCEDVEIKKEPQVEEPETREEAYSEIIEPNNDIKEAKVVNQRVINVSGGNYFEHVENLVIKEDD